MLEDRDLEKYDYISFMDRMMERVDDGYDGYDMPTNGHH